MIRIALSLKRLLFLVTASISNDKSKWVSQELSKSDRPELASAKSVVSGGKFSIVTCIEPGAGEHEKFPLKRSLFTLVIYACT